MKEIIILSADPTIRATMEAIFKRCSALKIREIGNYQRDFIVDPLRDPHVARAAHEMLRPQANRYHRALVVFDRQGSGMNHLNSREMLEAEVEGNLARSGWLGRCAAVAIDPELESWAWAQSPHAAKAMGWDNFEEVRNWLISEGFQFGTTGKPLRPKQALISAMSHHRIPKSASVFVEIATKVSLQRCSDPAFLKLVATLQTWFPK